MTKSTNKNMIFITGILLMAMGMQLANYGTAICVSGDVMKMNAMQYYVFISANGSLGMLLILSIVGKLTSIIGQRNMILYGILLQILGRVGMIFSSNWMLYTSMYLLQSIGGGFYISSAYVNMSAAVEPQERPRFFGYIAVANACGAIVGPLLVSALYAAGGMLGSMAYLANLPFTIIGFLMIYPFCVNIKNPAAARGFDYPGVAYVVLALTCLTYLLNLAGKMFSWISIPSGLLVLGMVAGFYLLITRELKIENPAVPLKMFKNKRLSYAFIGGVVASAFGTCTASYSIMWVRANFSTFPLSTLFNGSVTLPQQVVIFVLGLFLGGYISRSFTTRFRKFGIAAMVAGMIATGLLFCLRFTGTAAAGNLVMFGAGMPAGMMLIWVAAAIGGFMSVVSQSTFSAFWQSNTPKEEIPSGQALYSMGATGGSVIFAAVVGLVMGNSTDYTIAFAVGFVFAAIGFVAAVKGFRFDDNE